MASEDDSQEKTEDPTPKREKEAKEKGQIARSRELTTTLIMLVGSGSLFMLGMVQAEQVAKLFTESFTIERAAMFSDTTIVQVCLDGLKTIVRILLPFLLICGVVAMLGPIALGGWIFSIKTMQPKLEKLSPLKGFKRMFSMNAVLELVKALAKFSVIASVAFGVIWLRADSFLALGHLEIKHAIKEGMYLLASTFVYVSAALIVIASVDVPYQIWQHTKKLKMSMQEIKDEYKETEGKPEVKRKIRELQQKLSQGRMMQNVPKADVVITNPTHYAVALKYDTENGNAPILLAKGLDEIAMTIIKIANSHDVAVVSVPPLARALYYSTELEDEIPAGLYIAVAQVLAYVYQLKRYERGQAGKPLKLNPDLPIPDELKRDE